ncbi:MAG: hypothetical protein QG608_3569 [Actinomycetota bacterium]|nr:hypothetical protein [Actinomycetota bacterium]
MSVDEVTFNSGSEILSLQRRLLADQRALAKSMEEQALAARIHVDRMRVQTDKNAIATETSRAVQSPHDGEFYL